MDKLTGHTMIKVKKTTRKRLKVASAKMDLNMQELLDKLLDKLEGEKKV